MWLFPRLLLLPNPGGIAPTIEIIVRHAFFDQPLAAGEDVFPARDIGEVQANLFVIAGIINLIELMPGAKLGTNCVPY